eukprot:8398496-Pyramimonas_sp.AAC.1
MKSEDERVKVHEGPTATNVVDGCTTAWQPEKFPERRARFGMGVDGGDEVETGKRGAFSSGSGQ